MKRSRMTFLCLVGLTATWTTAQAQPSVAEGAAGQVLAGDDRPVTDIRALIEKLSAEMDVEFIVPDSLPWDQLGWSTAADNADYETLLALLRLREFAAFETADQIVIVPAATVRAEPTLILNDDDSRVSDHEVVTRLIEVENVPVAQLIPMLRPMMPQGGQMSAVTGSDTLILIDRYDNIRRLTEVIETIDDNYTGE